MKVTRFVNGKQINRSLGTDMIIENNIISGTIEEINRRIKADNEKRGERKTNNR